MVGQAGVVTPVTSGVSRPGKHEGCPCGHQQATVLPFPTLPSPHTHPAGSTLPQNERFRVDT